jgi:hypothetical protein
MYVCMYVFISLSPFRQVPGPLAELFILPKHRTTSTGCLKVERTYVSFRKGEKVAKVHVMAAEVNLHCMVVDGYIDVLAAVRVPPVPWVGSRDSLVTVLRAVFWLAHVARTELHSTVLWVCPHRCGCVKVTWGDTVYKLAKWVFT